MFIIISAVVLLIGLVLYFLFSRHKPKHTKEDFVENCDDDIIDVLYKYIKTKNKEKNIIVVDDKLKSRLEYMINQETLYDYLQNWKFK